MEVKTENPRETQKVAHNLAKELKGGDTIALYGDLGAGKTVFAQGLAKGLGIKRRILSPTFVFMRSYPVKKKGREVTFYHIDLYRGENPQDFEALGLGDIFDENSIVVLEWPEKIQKILPKSRIDVTLNVISPTKRKISIKRRK